MSNLVPEYRTDKNGRNVLRHVRPNGSAPSGTTIPPVTLKQPDRAQVIKGINDTLAAALRKNFPEGVLQNDLKKAAPALNSYTEVTLSRIKSYPWNYYSARRLALGVSTTSSHKWTESTVNDFMAISTKLDLTGEESISGMHIDSWRHYGDDLHPANNNGDYPEERMSQLVALMRITDHMEDQDLDPYWYDYASSDAESYFLDDDDLRDFVLNPPSTHKREDIVDIITTNDVYDVERIKEMLESSSTSLSSGVL